MSAGAAAAQPDSSTLAAFHKLEYNNWQKAPFAYKNGFGLLTCQSVPDVLASVGCASGTKVLDVATGPGFAAEVAAKAGAEVVAVDFSGKMLELARERLAAGGMGDSVQLLEADAGNMPLPDDSFDAVVCNFGVLHLPVPEQFFREAFRVLRPGGKLAFTVWAPTPRTQAMEMVHKVVKEHGNPDVPLPQGPPFFRFADAEESARTLAEAGFSNAETKEVPLCWELANADDAFISFRDGTGRTAALLAGQTPEQLAGIEKAMREASEATRAGRPGDPVRFEMPCVLTTAQKPEA